ncbi:MAG: PDZ domain-containing protein [Proteobacteria bacterium]|nr:PDZ domain-containing protein [Pseudomonadota bacterium]
MKRLIILLPLLIAPAAVAAPPVPSSSSGEAAAQARNDAARAAAEAARAGEDAARTEDEAARTRDEAAHAADEAMKAADLQKRMNDLAQRMAELSVKMGDQASASALRYLADGKRGMLGVALDPDSAGLRVNAVTPGGPAERAGIRNGDVIAAIDGQSVRKGNDGVLAGELAAGKPVTLSVLRDGKPMQLKVTPERFQTADWQALARTADLAAQRSLAMVDSPEFRAQINRNLADAMKQTEQARAQVAAQWGKGFNLDGRWFAPWWGLNLASLNPELGRYFGTDKGALVLSSDAKRYPGLQAGDVITAVNGNAVAQPEDTMRALQALPTDKPVHLAVLRHGKPLAVDLKSPPRWDVLPPLPPLPPAPPAPVAPPSPPSAPPARPLPAPPAPPSHP